MFNLNVNERDRAGYFARSLTEHRLARLELGNQIEETALPLRRIREYFFVQPFDGGEIELARPLGEEQLEEIREELLQQDLETLIVVHDARSSAEKSDSTQVTSVSSTSTSPSTCPASSVSLGS